MQLPPAFPSVIEGIEMWCKIVYWKLTSAKAFTEFFHCPFLTVKQNDSIMPSLEFKQKLVLIHLVTRFFTRKKRKDKLY